MAKPTEKIVMNQNEIDRALKRMAQEILEKNSGAKELVFIGVLEGGVPIARILADIIQNSENVKIPLGAIDISFYRDDLSIRGKNISPKKSEINFSIDGKTVVLIDDVLFHGRTARAALDALNDYGRPARVQLAVLIDRGYRELPIQPDYCGKKISVSPDISVVVQLSNEREKKVFLK